VTAGRKAIHASVPCDVHDTWHDVAAESGCSLSALVVALADDLGVVVTDAVVRRARRIDASNRRRRQ